MPAAENPLVRSTATRVAIIASWEHLPLRLRPATPLTDDELFDFCVANGDLKIERTPDGELVIMPPTGGEIGRQNAEIVMQLAVWAKTDGTGIVFDSSTGFMLSNGAERAPDAAWVTRSRWDALSTDERRRFPPLCPDFVIELRSPSERRPDLLAKMEEYVGCGVRLAWVIDPEEHRVHVFRPGNRPIVLEEPSEVDASPELAGFVLDLRPIW